MNVLVFLALRALHVLVAATWIGSHLFIAKMMMPVIEQSGPSGGQVMMRLNRRGINAFMASLGVVTVVTGVYLLWRFTGGFDPSVITTHAGLAFGSGGVSGILAGIVGGAVVGRNATRVERIMTQTAGAPDGTAKDALVRQAMTLRQRMKTGSSVVLALQMIALVLMAIGHYV